MKVLFLDFDGVLNNQPFLIKSHREAKKLRDISRSDCATEAPVVEESDTDHWIRMIDPDAVERLNEVVRRTNCAIVVSSSWRLINTVSDLQHFLELRGFSYSLLDRTPNCKNPQRDGTHRGYEIQCWIDSWNEKNPDDLVDQFAIVDDDSDMDHLMHKLVLTGFTVGLQDAHVEQLVSLLGEDLF